MSVRTASVRGVTLRGALLSFRVQRFETTVIVGAAVLSVVVSAIVIQLFTSPAFAACQVDGEAALSRACQTGLFPWLSRIARLSLAIVPIFPVVAGLLAGGPIVARELETGTARLAWSLGPSRLRWLAQRAIPILVMVAVAGVAIGITANALTHLLSPTLKLDGSFVGFRSRGMLIGVQAVLVASIALALGAVLGRSVPTLVLSLILVGALGVAVDKVERTLLTAEAQVAEDSSYAWDENLFLESKLRLADGTIATYEEAVTLHPELNGGWDESSGIRSVVLYIPGSRYPEIERREAVALLAIAAGFIALSAVAVVRRRPR